MIDFLKSAFSKKEDRIVEGFKSLGYDFLGCNNECSDLVASLSDYYKIQKKNPTAFAMKNKIAQKVGKNGIYLEKDGDIVDDKKALSSVLQFFSIPNFQAFKDEYYTQYFASGDIYLSAKNQGGKLRVFVVDSRGVSKVVNGGEIVGFEQNGKKFSTEDIYNHIVRKDPDKPFFGMSIYTPLVYDALSSMETSKRNYYFFKNSARPDMVVLFEKIEGMKKEEMDEMVKQFEKRYKGTQNSNKVYTSNAIKDIKVLDINHKDLQLLELDQAGIKKIGMVFGIDPRLLGFSDDVGAYATMKEISKHSMEAIQTYSIDLEQDMNNVYRMFVSDSFPYNIRLDGETFDDRDALEERQRKDIELGVITIEEARIERGLPTEALPDRAKTHLIRNNIVLSPTTTQNEPQRAP